jgi:hypothetical protein
MLTVQRTKRLIMGLCSAGVVGAALAQPMPIGETVTSFSLYGLNQFNTSMNEGGSFDWYETGAALGIARQFDAQWSAQFSVDYNYQKWSWSDATAFGGQAPWQSINTPQIGLNLTYSPSPFWRLGISPSIEWSAESGVGTSDSATYGAVFLATHTVSPSLTFGLGAGVFRQIDQNRVFPFLIVNWRITDNLTLKNPLPAGPAGGAGLELAYSLSNQWTVGAGAAYRSYRFRLNDEGPFAGGIGQNRLIPVFARISYRLTPATRFDLYAIGSAGGNVQAQSADGVQTVNSGYRTGLGVGLNLSHRF